MSTVEAMAAGCVPVVINRGGQPEIVTHDVNGLLWDTEEQLLKQTKKVAGDEAYRQKLSLAAVERAKGFSKQNFERSFSAIIAQWGS
jgi:glycosyltransferase involved in cell wall biosynthesis